MVVRDGGIRWAYGLFNLSVLSGLVFGWIGYIVTFLLSYVSLILSTYITNCKLRLCLPLRNAYHFVIDCILSGNGQTMYLTRIYYAREATR